MVNQNLIRRLPAEWEQHEATILAMPFNKEDWPGKFIPIQWVYHEIIKYLSRSEKVRLILPSKKSRERFESQAKKTHIYFENIEYHYLQMDRNWMRDSAPAFVINTKDSIAQKELIHFKFNGWAKYSNWKKDSKLPNYLSNKIVAPLSPAFYNDKHIVLEGGAIDTNGDRTLITTEECLLDQNIQSRNPGLSRIEYEKIFFDYLGITKTIWLKNGITGDDTHGHIDDLCRFINKNTVVICSDTNPADENYYPLAENLEILSGEKTASGEKLIVFKLPMPSPIIFDGMRLPASYANFYISNDFVLVPTFNDPMDRIALGILSDLFSDRTVVGIHAVDLVWGLGTLHCLTHEEPKI